MQAYIVSDHESVAAKVRNALLRHGQECPPSHVIPLENAKNRLAKAQAELVVVVLHPDPERALLVPAELRSVVNGRILAVGPAGDSRLVLRALRSGADDYIDDFDLETELDAALSRIKEEESIHAEQGRTIAVLAPSGGSGSSTLAVNVATTLAKLHKSVALIDLKLEAGDLAALLDLKPSYTLADLCQNLKRMDRVMFERTLTKHESGVHLLASPRVLADIPHVTPDGVRQALALARASFPYVVIDLDHTFREEQSQALRQTDLILVLRLEFTSLRNARRTLEHLEHLGFEKDRVRVVVNRYGQAKEVPPAKAEAALDRKIFHYVPEDASSVNRANNNGVPVVLESPSAKVSKSVIQLVKTIDGRRA